jgi:hypothetical protein
MQKILDKIIRSYGVQTKTHDDDDDDDEWRIIIKIIIKYLNKNDKIKMICC